MSLKFTNLRLVKFPWKDIEMGPRAPSQYKDVLVYAFLL